MEEKFQNDQEQQCITTPTKIKKQIICERK